MKKFIYIFLTLLLASSSGLLAKESLQAANWCFGMGGQITFKNGSPQELGYSSVATYEGVATISDQNGDLLFYTDGMEVWSKNHNRMPNGYGLFGHKSSSQSGVIVPYPGNPKMFYVFSVDALWESKDPNRGFRYSIVDLSKNGGLGDITTKNQLLFAPSCEKVTAVGHINGKDIWVLGQRWQDNKICVYLVDKDGIHFDNEYSIKALAKYSNTGWTKGYMKFSQKGDLLAVANNNVSLALYDFDIRTGVVSNERYTTDECFQNAYGVEFSPNSKYLYVSSTPYDGNKDYNNLDYSYLLQVDLEKAKSSTIEQSYNILGKYKYIADTEAFMGALQLALDGKIYFASVKRANRLNQQSNYLSVINKPDQEACDYVFKGYKLKNSTAYLGLPTFIQSFFRPEVTKFVTTDFCDGDNIILQSDYFKGYKYLWFGPNNFVSDTCDTIIINPDKSFAGTYKLFVTDTFGFKDSTLFEVKYHKTDITSGITDNNADKFVMGNYNKTLTLTNNYSESAVIDSLYLKSGTKYSFENMSVPFTIHSNEVMNYKILIDSRKSGSFKDTVVLSIHQPCPYYDKIALADSISRLTLHVVLPDTTVNLGQIFTSDIKVYLEPKTGLDFTFDLNFTYSYLSYIYNTTKYQAHQYTKAISGDNELYTLNFPQLAINDSTIILTKVRGITLLCNEYMTPLDFIDATLSNPDIDLVLHNGKIQVLREDCTKDMFQIKGTNVHVAFSQPAPLTEGGKIELFSPDKGPLRLTIYTAMGQKVEEMKFESNGAFGREIEPDLTKYSSGLYTLIWESNINTCRRTIVISK